MAKDKRDITPDKENEEGKKAQEEQKTEQPAEGNDNKEVEALQEKLQEMNDRYLRLSAEFDNYRKRTLKEKMELTKSAGEQILCNILPVVDNFERALKSMETAKDVEALKEGVDLIYINFKDFCSLDNLNFSCFLILDSKGSSRDSITWHEILFFLIQVKSSHNQ